MNVDQEYAAPRFQPNADLAYLRLLHDITAHGSRKTDRTGTGTISLFGTQLGVNVETYLPILTTKRMALKAFTAELVWMLSGDTNVAALHAMNSTIWDEWADENGDLGPVYGAQWRAWAAPDGSHIDQVQGVIDTLKRDPDSRRMMVSAWNAAALPDMALQPCHFAWQLNHDNGYLDLQWYQRSCDAFLGGPANLMFYGLLLHMLAHHTGYKPRNVIGAFGDTHIYLNHMQQVTMQLSRGVMSPPRWRPQYAADKSIFDVTQEDLLTAIHGYVSHPAISAPVAV